MTTNKFLHTFSSIWKLITGIKPWPKAIRAYLSPAKTTTQQIELRGSGIRLKTRGGIDIRNIKETFLDRVYEKLNTPIGNGWTVIDIGGGIGDFTVYVALTHPESVVYTFEPDPQAFSLLEENLRINRVKNAIPFQRSILSQASTLVDIDSGNGLDSSANNLEENSPFPMRDSHPLSFSLADTSEQIGFAHCNLLKMDCRGAERAILFNTPDEILNRTERIILQFHEEESDNIRLDLGQFLADKGFAVKIYPNFPRSSLGYLYACR